MSGPLDRRLLTAAPAVRSLLISLAALQVVAALLVVCQAGLLADVVVGIFSGHRSAGALATPLLLLAAVGVGRAIVKAVEERRTGHASLCARAQLRGEVLTAVTRLGPLWAGQQDAGRIATAAGPGLDALDGYLTRAMPAMVAACVVPPVVLIRIGLADWQSALILVVVLPLVPLFMVLVGVTTGKRMEEQYAILSRLSGHFLDLVRGLPTLKIYGQADRQVQTVRRGTELYRRRTMATLRIAFLSGLVLDLIATLSVAVVAVYVGLRLDHSHVSLTTALIVLLLAPELFAPLRAVGAQHHATEEGRVAAGAALDVIGTAPALGPSEAPEAAARMRIDGSIRFEAVAVQYPGRGAPALGGLSLAVASGQVVAITGRSGAGKSTLLATLLRYVHASGGRIVARGGDGRDIELATIAESTWRAGLAWVPQRPRPTQATIGDEVALGDPGASDEQILAALQACDAPAATTELGEDGVQISAGQRRRVALARAVLRARAIRDAGSVPIVLLDEPSEDLDQATEEIIASVVDQMAGWATVVMVTHSPQLLAVARRRVTIAAGLVIADEPRSPKQGAVRFRPVDTSRGESSPHIEDVVESGPPVTLPPLLVTGQARRRLLLAAGLNAATGLAGLALTATSIWLICRAAQHPNVQALALAVVGVRTFALARALLRYAERLVGHNAALGMLADLRARVFAALEPLAPAGLAGFRRGDLLRRFVGDVDGIGEGFVRAVIPLAGGALAALGAVVLAGFTNVPAALALTAGLACGVAVAPWLAQRIAGDGVRVAACVGARDACASAMVDGLAELTAYGAERRAVHDIAARDRDAIALAGPAVRAAALGTAVTGLASALTLPAVLAFAATAAAAGSMPPIQVGVLVACVLAGFDALTPLPAAFAAAQRFRAGGRRVAMVLAAPPPFSDPAEVPHLDRVATTRVGVSVTGATVAPAAGASPVLVGADLDVRSGDRIAIVGASGCGKSTLLAATLRLLPVCHGKLDITDDGHSTSLTRLRSRDMPPLVAGSLQGDHVFDASLGDNVRVVRPDATDAELDAVAARVGLTEFIAALPQRWSAPSGPDGSRLSGGQRQRLLLARALLADPLVLVLDEPTAHLDPATEAAVFADLVESTRGRTVLMSTHRRALADQFDRVVAIEECAVVGVATRNAVRASAS